MTEPPDDGRFTFSTSNIWPQISDLDPTFNVSIPEALRLIQDSTFWMFMHLPSAGLWPVMREARVDYPQRFNRMQAPFKINGWIIAREGDNDFTLTYLLRPEAEPDSAPLLTAEIRWQVGEIGVHAPAEALGAVGEEFRSSTGTLM